MQGLMKNLSRLNLRKWLVLSILAALVIRMLLALMQPGTFDDELVYLRMAQNLNQGNGLVEINGDTTTTFFPLLPIIIAGTARVLQNYTVSGYLVMAFFGSLVLVPVYLLGKHLVSEKIGLMAAALAAVYPLLAYYSSRIYTEAVYTFFLLVAIFFVWQLLERPRFVHAAIAGGSLGLAYLTNPGAVFYLVAFSGLAIIVAFKKRIWRSMAGPFGLFLLIFVLLASPYLLFLHSQLGKWTYSGKNGAANIGAGAEATQLYSHEWAKKYLTLTEDGQEVLITSLLRENPDPMRDAIFHPLRTIKIFVNNANKFYSQTLNNAFPVWLFALAGLGLFAQGWDRKILLRNGYILLMMTPGLFILTMDIRSRFFIPFATLSVIWVAQGWHKLEQWSTESASTIFSSGISKRVSFRILPWLVGAVVLLPLFPFSAGKVLSEKDKFSLGIKEAGEWVKQEAGPGKRIMGNEPGAPFYADGVGIEEPYADYDQATKYARLKGVDYTFLRVSSKLLNPLKQTLLEDEASHPDWQLVERVRPGTAQETLVFELKK